MKVLYILFGLFISQTTFSQNVGIGTNNPMNTLHVAGDARLESLGGTAMRVIQTNTNGEVLEIPKGNTGEILTQTIAGPTWQPAPSSGGGSGNSNDTCCPKCGVMENQPCPTMISNISTTTMTIGECMRYYASLTEGGHNDWRMPTMKEVLGLYHLKPIIPASAYDEFWTVSLVETASLYSVLHITNGELGEDAGNEDNYCHCAR